MPERAVISKHLLDELIRAKLDATLCRGVDPLPVAWRAPVNGNCNWVVPGWTGDSGEINRCMQHMDEYLRILRTQFDIPREA
jgi:hypothetical protein